MAYATTVVALGEEAETFLAEDMAITFSGEAPEGLRPYCFLIAPAELDGSLAAGQEVLIGEQIWTITAIGEVAEKNLASLGHVTLVFDGGPEPRMPGAIHLGGLDEKPALTLGASLIFACA
ncbi:PTS glucitol/sorbitol transporter subunit IIA [Tessaracoccus palaemonis]|uniref:PTS glucitol/sorbitol transporter subunit IIA n=1 Tax=Tessaracoccus palaemonis TaxID=2829499 RepID=A0ABX8SKE0_9ACTN|nr:PTS glucitol/sorbitol transporter subunit IIA [Tessaracoccus palaemonis]QXT63444.1 PTS glucitol/sorbitol transporter subunit IIA [Tessaracoccus palaemonis]